MKRIEQQSVAESIIVPRINKIRSILPMEQQLYITEKINQLPKNKNTGTCLEHIFGFLPALSSYVRILTASGLDINRKDPMNDFFDKELLIYGLSYSSQFVAIDRWITRLVSLAKEDGDLGFLAYSGSLSELKPKIESMQ